MLMTVEDLAVLLNVTPAKVYRLARRGDIPCRRLGREYRFHPGVIGCWILGGSTATGDPTHHAS